MTFNASQWSFPGRTEQTSVLCRLPTELLTDLPPLLLHYPPLSLSLQFVSFSPARRATCQVCGLGDNSNLHSLHRGILKTHRTLVYREEEGTAPLHLLPSSVYLQHTSTRLSAALIHPSAIKLRSWGEEYSSLWREAVTFVPLSLSFFFSCAHFRGLFSQLFLDGEGDVLLVSL